MFDFLPDWAKDIGNKVQNIAKNPFISPWGASAAGLGTNEALKTVGIGNDPAAQDPYAGMPQRPQFSPTYGPDYTQPGALTAKGAGGPGAAYQALLKRATGGTSPWATMALQKNDLNRQTTVDDATNQGAAAAAAARSGLATRGGLTGGAAERIAHDQGRDLIGATQTARRDNQVQDLGVLSQDDQQKQAALNPLMANDQARGEQDLAANKFNIQNIMSQKSAKDQADLAAYQSQMQAWAAGKQSNAIEKGGK